VAAPNLKVAAAQKIASKLIGAGLVREIRAKAGAPVWRRDENAGLSYALSEDESIRVLSVSIAPGQTEPPHHHRWPSVFVIDRLGKKMRDFDSDGREIPLPLPEKFELPLTVNMPPQPVHYVRNEDTVGFHGTRIEFKRGFNG
jgi:predicted metal-dependent enzyme (double-stranded beta helix superfamily)